MTLLLMFAGQGMQHGGMLPWLDHDATVQSVEQSLGADWRTRLDGPAWAGCNARAQF
jgi:[acyl-carrier-protein] S-malonyltransferase